MSVLELRKQRGNLLRKLDYQVRKLFEEYTREREYYIVDIREDLLLVETLLGV